MTSLLRIPLIHRSDPLRSRQSYNMHVLYGTLTDPNICRTILKLTKKGINLYSSWIGLRVNMDTLNVRRDSICQNILAKNYIGTRRLKYLQSDKRHTEYNSIRENVYPLPVARTNRLRNFIPWALYNCQ